MSYEGKVRVRVCGLLVEDCKILLLRHEGLGPEGYMWLPPGGGVEFNESAPEALVKEFLEETDLQIEVQNFLFVNEHKDSKHHAIELFFRVERVGGTVKLGIDPELDTQILSEIAFFSIEELAIIKKDALHSTFRNIQSLEDLFELTGYYKFVRQ